MGKRRFNRNNFVIKKVFARVNEQIRVPEVFLVDEDGNALGRISRDEALSRARSAELDLVEVSPKAQPPVCKIIDYGKYKYEQEKQAKKQRAKNKAQDQKEIRLSLNIEENDLKVKSKKAQEFLEKRHKVKVNLMLKGREMAFKDKAFEILNNFVQRMEGLGKIEVPVKKLGRQFQLIMAPTGGKRKETAAESDSETDSSDVDSDQNQ